METRGRPDSMLPLRSVDRCYKKGQTSAVTFDIGFCSPIDNPFVTSLTPNMISEDPFHQHMGPNRSPAPPFCPTKPLSGEVLLQQVWHDNDPFLLKCRRHALSIGLNFAPFNSKGEVSIRVKYSQTERQQQTNKYIFTYFNFDRAQATQRSPLAIYI